LVHLLPGANLLDLSGFNLDLAELLKCRVDVVSDNSIHWSIKDKIIAEAVSL
jgi:predicted nucleotidyltransferase